MLPGTSRREDEMSENEDNIVRPFAVQPAVNDAAVMAALDAQAEPDIEDLVAGEPPTEGMDVLAALSGATEDEASATGSYGYDKTIAEAGKWFKWPKLGPTARVHLCSTQSKKWKAVRDRVRVIYAEDDGSIPPATMDTILAPMMVKSVFDQMEGIVVQVGQPPLTDSIQNRLQLLNDFEGLRDELFKVCAKPKNFRDLSDKVLGNS